ncbi:MAG TPA: TetR/AcrR family transcriptional regulator [Mycobacteriales bacterium]|nr:TetR/AcrR family transcriptional regulator [Mycobacteriales bacterium]
MVSVPSDRALQTRAALLQAALEVFAASGFAEANVTDVVGRAGASVGSLYHHFGGKADLYLALFDEYQSRQEARAAAAVRDARTAGVPGELGLFLAGTRGYLYGCWEDRDVARLFLPGGGPPGFELVARRRFRAWVRRNGALLGHDGGKHRLGEALTLVLTTVISEAGREVAVQSSERAAHQLAEDVIELIGRLALPDL